MYLKQLESIGFKSFAERINIEFVPGVTAIVGPNGSGKSNITDAIRWVLGEQSVKSLRGSRMEDIIFQGSDSRNPLNFAEVTLVLDNSDQALPLDFDQVSITRRVYRSGSSEFSINKQSCRLKDIIDLFMDSGLGQEAFSIISQGKVEEVLSSKAEERRTIFEEAAGVLKYKHRKRKAEYKLAETQENLSRINDIIHEIEQQIDPLHEQAETAKKYKEQSEILKREEISLLVTEIEQFHEEWQHLLTKIDEEKMNEIDLKTAIQKKEAKLTSERNSLQKLDQEIEDLQASLLTTTEQLKQSEGKRHVLNERTKHFSENKEKYDQQIDETVNQIKKLQENLTKVASNLAELEAVRGKTKQTIEQLKSKLTAKKKEDVFEQIEERKSEYIEYLNKQAAKRNEKQSIQRQLQQMDGKKDIQAGKRQDLLALKERLTKNLNEISENVLEKEKCIAKKETNIEQLKSTINKEQYRFEESQEKLYKGYQTIAKLTSRKEMLEEMKEDFQGFFHGVKVVLQAKQKKALKNIHGAVIEIMDVPEAYLTAIETVLGGQAQHIVVKDDTTAREAISWLKKTNNGRATFLPIESIKSRFLTKDMLRKIEKHPGFVGSASSLVHTEKRYEKIINHLMGHVIVARTLKDANEMAKLIMRRNRIVTLDGDVVNPGGSMSGGAKKKTNQSLFTRERDLQEVTKKLTEFQNRTKSFEQKTLKQKEHLKQMSNELKIEEESLSTEQKKVQEIESSYKNVDMELVTLNDNLAFYNQDTQQLNQERKELQARNERLLIDLNEVDQQLIIVQAQVARLTDQETDFKEDQEQIKLDLHRHQITLAEQDERVRSEREKTAAIQRQLTELEEQHNMYASDLEELLHLQQSDEAESEIDRYILDYKSKKEKITNQIQQKRMDRSQRTQQIEDQERDLKEENKQHHLYMQTIQQKEVQANRLDVNLENLLSDLQSEYTITFEKAKATYEKTTNISEAKSNVSQLKQAIKQLGTVNLGAIDEYKRISERYTFLTDQKDDLVVAKQTLYSIISEMDEVMKKRFEETFSNIKEEFAIVFKELFGGGFAELSLTDPKSILDTGIEIIAQPPGKKLQHLGLLSGGERALTAIALLFSILRVRPVPFCVLDEVEAALDEANVVRFAKYVKLHSENTQFIVITHRKGTMEEADVLYGVTMQESGVSRLVSVLLEDSIELVST